MPGVSDSFEGVIQYMDSFGGLARQGLKVLARQALLGGDYELVDRDTFLPNPDYCACPTLKRVRSDCKRAEISRYSVLLQGLHGCGRG